MRFLMLLILAVGAFALSGCRKDNTWYSVEFCNETDELMYEGRITGWQGVLGPSGHYGGITTSVPEEITIVWKSIKPGKEEVYKNYEKMVDVLFQNHSGASGGMITDGFPEIPDPPADIFNEHKVVLVLKGKLPKSPNGDIVITSLGEEKFDVKFQRDNGGVTDSDIKKQEFVIEDGVLDLSFSEITDKGLGNLKNTKDIEVLNLQGTAVTDSGLKHLSLFPNLVALNLNYTQVTGRGFVGLRLDKLKYLSLERSAYQDRHLKNLSDFENLEVISMIRTDISDLSGLQKLKRLRIINLAASPVSDSGLRDITRLESLEQLTLVQSDISDEGIKYLVQLRKLKSLRLGMTNISDAAVKELSVMPSLVYIELSGTRITEDALEWIVKFPNLELVDLRSVPFSKEELKHLKQQCPNLEILTFEEISEPVNVETEDGFI